MTTFPIKVTYIIGTGRQGGIETHVSSILQCLDRSIIQPAVIVLYEGGPLSVAMAEATPVYVLGGPSRSKMSLAARLRACIKDIAPEIVHSHEMHFEIGFALLLLPRIKWIHTEHCSFEYGPSPRKAKLLWRLFAWRLSQIIAVSEFTRTSLLRNTQVPAQRTVVVYNSVIVSTAPQPMPSLRAALGLPEGAIVIGGLGRMVAQKGWLDFLSVAFNLLSLRSDISFILIGDGPLLALLQRQVNEGIHADRFYFLGARSEARQLLSEFNIFLFTSLHEELPCTLLEAFAERIPVVGFLPVGGTEEVLSKSPEPTARLVKIRDPATVASEIHALLQDEAERRRREQAGTVLVTSRFSASQMTETLQQIYARALIQPSSSL